VRPQLGTGDSVFNREADAERQKEHRFLVHFPGFAAVNCRNVNDLTTRRSSDRKWANPSTMSSIPISGTLPGRWQRIPLFGPAQLLTSGVPLIERSAFPSKHKHQCRGGEARVQVRPDHQDASLADRARSPALGLARNPPAIRSGVKVSRAPSRLLSADFLHRDR
jgi:hypothetical protein